MTQVTEQQEAPRERLAESAQAAHAAVAGLDRGYARRLAEALHENGDPVSVDAAEEFERLLAGAPTAQAAPAAQGDALDAARESEYRRGYRHGYEQRDAEVRGALV